MSIVQPAQFDQDDNVRGQKFLASLNLVAQQAAAANSINSSSLEISVAPTGITIDLPYLNIPPIPTVIGFPAIITSISGTACAWTAEQPATPGTWATSTSNGGAPLSGTTGTDPAYEMHGRTWFPANYRTIIYQQWANDGAPTYWFNAPLDGMFQVTVEKTGGSDGTQTTKATWTYTVRDLTGAITLGTAKAQTKPRSNGSMTFQASTTGIGLAYYSAPPYSSSTLVLWDAGEVLNTGTGC